MIPAVCMWWIFLYIIAIHMPSLTTDTLNEKFSPISPPAFIGENLSYACLAYNFLSCVKDCMATFTAFCELGVMFTIIVVVVTMVENMVTVVILTSVMVECLVVVVVLVSVIFISFVTVSVEVEVLVVAEMLRVVCVSVTVDVHMWVVGVALAQKLLRNLSTFRSHPTRLSQSVRL